MKFIEKQSSLKGKHADVYIFKMGQNEIVLLRDMLLHYNKHTPKTFFNIPFRARTEAMFNEFAKLARAEGLGKYLRVKGGWHEGNPDKESPEVL